MNFLNGLKTIVGVVGTGVTIIFPKVTPGVVQVVGDNVVQIAYGVFGTLTALGLVHKAQKSREGTPVMEIHPERKGDV